MPPLLTAVASNLAGVTVHEYGHFYRSPLSLAKWGWFWRVTWGGVANVEHAALLVVNECVQVRTFDPDLTVDHFLLVLHILPCDGVDAALSVLKKPIKGGVSLHLVPKSVNLPDYSSISHVGKCLIDYEFPGGPTA
jgi:hypothetical protein